MFLRCPRCVTCMHLKSFELTDDLTRWAAIRHSKETEEVFCHALGYLVDRILKEAK